MESTLGQTNQEIKKRIIIANLSKNKDYKGIVLTIHPPKKPEECNR